MTSGCMLPWKVSNPPQPESPQGVNSDPTHACLTSRALWASPMIPQDLSYLGWDLSLCLQASLILRECKTQQFQEVWLHPHPTPPIPHPECPPVGLAARGDGGNRVELAEESLGLRLLKKLLNSPHLRDSTSVDFPDPEWPNSLSLILGWRFCVGRSCWMKSPLCVS